MTNNGVEYVLSLKDLFTSKIRGATQETEKLNGAVNQTQSSISGLGSALGSLGLVVGLGALANEMLTVGASFEQANIGLKTLLKSGEEADKVFNQLKKDAESSPFSFETLLMGNKALISAGMSASNARDDFNNLSNAIAATGGGNDELQRMVINMQQIKNLGKASALDVKQFAFAGVNMYALLDDYAKKYNLTLDKENITYEQLSGALKYAAGEGGMYFNGLKNLADSTSGKLSNLKDAFKNTLYDVFVALKPVIDNVVVAITGMFNMIKQIIDFIQEHKTLFGIFASVLAAIATGMAVVKAQIIATTIAQWALNTATAVFDALSGNWVALAAGAAALAAGIYMAAQAQDTLNQEMGKQPSAAQAINPLQAKGGAQMGGTKPQAAASKGGTSTSAVESKGVQNFNISINKLVEKLDISTTTIKESGAAIKEEVAKALLEAVNDFQLLATK